MPTTQQCVVVLHGRDNPRPAVDTVRQAPALSSKGVIYNFFLPHLFGLLPSNWLPLEERAPKARIIAAWDPTGEGKFSVWAVHAPKKLIFCVSVDSLHIQDARRLESNGRYSETLGLHPETRGLAGARAAAPKIVSHVNGPEWEQERGIKSGR